MELDTKNTYATRKLQVLNHTQQNLDAPLTWRPWQHRRTTVFHILSVYSVGCLTKSS